MSASAWASPYSGILRESGAAVLRAHDPRVAIHAASVVPWGPRRSELPVGGAGWDAPSAEAACLGEAIERLEAYPTPRDGSVEASAGAWPLDEPPVDPASWVLFHAEQYAQRGFPFAPFTRSSVTRWVCFREATTGEARWVPEELAFVFSRAGVRHAIAPSSSTGLSCGRVGGPVLLRGLQEVVERDALLGAWWERYALEEHDPARVLDGLGPLAERVRRPNLAWRFYRVATPFSFHVTIATLSGEDLEGPVFAVGSACRETRLESFRKATLEAVQGRHYVRWLKARRLASGVPLEVPRDFSEHAVYYSLHPERLAGSVLDRAVRASREGESDGAPEGLEALAERLAPRPVLFRNTTPAAVAAADPSWLVLRVLVPGLQPLHADHALPHLGGPLWAPRSLGAWASVRPHPLP